MKARLFVCCMPTGLSYCDTQREEHGDYLVVARLPFSTLVLEWHPGKHPPELRSEIERHAATIIARRGEEYPVDMCGHTVTLGRR